MPPYDFADTYSIPPNPNFPGSYGFVNAFVQGQLQYYLDTPMDAPAPSNWALNAVVGILIPQEGLPGWPLSMTTVTMSGILSMVGNAGCEFFGLANSEGSVGWQVASVDPNTGQIVGIVDSTYQEQYYLDVNYGESATANPYSGTPFSTQVSFLTTSQLLYEAYVWLWGGIQASGSQEPLHSSRAAGEAQLGVESIAWSWQPFFF